MLRRIPLTRGIDNSKQEPAAEKVYEYYANLNYSCHAIIPTNTASKSILLHGACDSSSSATGGYNGSSKYLRIPGRLGSKILIIRIDVRMISLILRILVFVIFARASGAAPRSELAGNFSSLWVVHPSAETVETAPQGHAAATVVAEPELEYWCSFADVSPSAQQAGSLFANLYAQTGFPKKASDQERFYRNMSDREKLERLFGAQAKL